MPGHGQAKTQMKITPQNSFKLSVALGFSIIVLLALVMAGIGLMRVSDSNRTVEQLVGSNNVKTGLIHRMKGALTERMAASRLATNLPDPFKRGDEYQRVLEQGGLFVKARMELESMQLSAQEREILDHVKVLAARAQPALLEAIDLAQKGNNVVAARIIDQDVHDVQQNILSELDRLIELQTQVAEGVVSDSKKSFEFTRLHILVLVSFVIGLGLMIVPIVIRKANSQADSLQHEAMYDALTNLPNRLLVTDRLEQVIRSARHDGRGFALLIVDIDQFRKVNALFGQGVGDQVIQYLSACIQASVQETDTVGRMAGDEFAVLAMETGDVDSVIDQAIKIRESISAPIEIAGRTLRVTASTGIAIYPHHGEDADSLFHAADSALQAARQTKRGYRVFSGDMADGAEDRLALSHEFLNAIRKDQLVLHYQPKIDFKSRMVCGIEALIRWDHPSSGLLSPEQFIPLAERLGQIKPLNDWVIDNVLEQYQSWYQSGIRLPVSLKVTPASVEDPNFPEQMLNRLKVFSVPADRVEIEIKNAGSIDDPEQVTACLRRLNAMGFQIAIGDFGRGDSSMMRYLTELLVSNIKIDRNLVNGMGSNRGELMMVRTAVNLGHSLGLKVAAKGVESQDSWEALQGFGCDVAQGFFVSRPMPGPEFVDWLRSSPWGMASPGVPATGPASTVTLQ